MADKRPLVLASVGADYQLQELRDGDTIPVSLGGTGSSDPASARIALQVPSLQDLQTVADDLSSFKSRTDNPHQVTAVQVGAIPTNAINTANGVAGLDNSGKVPVGLIPQSVRPRVYLVSTDAERLALTPNEGDECIQSVDNSNWIYTDSGWYKRPSSTTSLLPEDFNYYQDTQVTSYNGSSWLDVATMSLNNISGGNYRVHISFSFNINSVRDSIVVDVVDSSGEPIWNEFYCEVKDSGGRFESTGSSQKYQYSKTMNVPLASFSDSLTVRMRCSRNRVVVSVWDIYMEVWKVS